MASKAISIAFEGKYSREAAARLAADIRSRLAATASVAFAFVTPDYVPYLEEFSEILRVDGHVVDLAGATGSGVIWNGFEREDSHGVAVVAIHAPGTTINTLEFSQREVEHSEGPGYWKRRAGAGADAWLVLGNPFLVAIDSWLTEWNRAFPGVPVIGGLASGGRDGTRVAVFHNNHIVEGAVLVGFRGPLRILPAISQGCRPIGEPLPVTRAENNIIFALGSRPAYQALESAFQSLSEAEKTQAQGNLFAGIASNEYVDEFKSGDFLIRTIIGADPNSGAVVIAGEPRVGQTIQYQLRDREAADSDLRSVLRSVGPCARPPLASLLFCCTGRGMRLFGKPNHDAEVLEAILGIHPSAGFFCDGEVGPVAGKNCVHGYTASCAVFCEGSL